MTNTLKSPTLPLGGELHIEQFGFGTWNLRGTGGQKAMEHALKVGYRHIDSADFYRNHDGLAKAMKGSGLKREDLFIVTKLWTHSYPSDRVGPAVDRFLQELEADYIDLLLIHWPDGRTPIADTLGAMEQARQAGKIRSVGVSNFGVREMEEALASGVSVVNNQIEYNLRVQPRDVLDYCLKNDVTVTSYTSLKRGSRGQEALVAELAQKYEASREQVLLNWLMGMGMIVIPRSKNPAHIEGNWAALSWEMEAGDVERVEQAR